MQQADDTLSRAKDGDQTAFARLVREHQSMVFSLALYFSHDRATAEDLAQEVFIHLYQSLGMIESPEHLKFWLRRVTCHRCIDHSRKESKRRTICIDDAPEPVSPDEFRDSLMSEALRRIVASLPEKPRLIVTLRYQEDLDPAEIANLLEMSINTVKSHLRRSLVILKDKVTRSLGEIKV